MDIARSDIVKSAAGRDKGKLFFDIALDGAGQIRQAIPLSGVLESLEKALAGHVNEPLGLLRDPTAGVSSGTVAVVPVLERTHVNGDDVPLPEHPAARDAVNP